MSGNGDPLFLQFKQARQSVLEPYCGASPFGHSASVWWWGSASCRRQAICPRLGYRYRPLKRHFFLRQLSDAKIKPVVEIMKEGKPEGLCRVVRHGTGSSARSLGDAAVLTGLHGKRLLSKMALADFSVAYADQNERDSCCPVERNSLGAR